MFVVLRASVPFEYEGREDFPAKLSDWIGHVFYDLLPEHGYEVREEQIYTAFQLAAAVCKGGVHLSEAGVGTGKTFAYLLAALPYARFTGKPVLIACATTALQEQLAGPEGDIETLSRLLDLDIDARMAKDPRQYVCEVKVDQLTTFPMEDPGEGLHELLQWAEATPRGERSEVPHVPDQAWRQVAWDETMPCETCHRRGFCKMIKSRKHYQATADLIVCDHEIFFEDLWTREERIDDDKLPLLPEYAAVILDEGHKVILPAAMRAGRQIVRDEMEGMLSMIERIPGARESLLSAGVATVGAATQFFDALGGATINDGQSDRLAVEVTDELLEAADVFRRALFALDFEVQNEEGLHTQSLPAGRLEAYEARVERATAALDQLCRPNRAADDRGGGRETEQHAGAIVWVDRADGSFWAVPREVGGLLQKYLFSKRHPVVFSSATLSTGGDFSYLARTLGLTEPSSSSVGGPFEYDEQAIVYVPRHIPSTCADGSGDSDDKGAAWRAWSVKELVTLLRRSEGRALVLTNTVSEVGDIRAGLDNIQLPFPILWEDQGERGYLARRFREDISSVLVGAGWWEGLDVPGEALSLLVIWRLPFPLKDPLIEARRRDAARRGLDPVTAVDYPEMGLRLKQGCGRLIRSQDDRGAIAILDPVVGTPWEQVVMDALPDGAKVVQSLDALVAREGAVGRVK